jgi:hypothetical protein
MAAANALVAPYGSGAYDLAPRGSASVSGEAAGGDGGDRGGGGGSRDDLSEEERVRRRREINRNSQKRIREKRNREMDELRLEVRSGGAGGGGLMSP